LPEVATLPANILLHSIEVVNPSIGLGGTPNISIRRNVYGNRRVLFSFCAHKAHLNFVPTGPSIEPFREELAGFKKGKDTIHFPCHRPLPRASIAKIATHRAKQVLDHSAWWMY
jgi:uncharacterized protein YdhG (YjbR/CyaY superfamily)